MKVRVPRSENDGEFLWLVSLSDLMILLFVFFVVLFSFAYQKMKAADFSRMGEIIRGEKKKDPLEQVQASLVKSLAENGLLESVEITKKDDALILQIKEKILFNSGEYDLKPESVQILGLISKSLETVPSPYRFGIEGHTDDVPISKPGIISDNWELSAKRAHSVLEALHFTDTLKKRSVIMGYGEMSPLLPNRDLNGNPLESNQMKNRRVTIRVY